MINERAAAIDIGARVHVAAVDPERCAEPVQTFQAFTGDFSAWHGGSRKWALNSGYGVDRRLLGTRLRDTGRSRHGGRAGQRAPSPCRTRRKSDVSDAQWLQRLPACG